MPNQPLTHLLLTLVLLCAAVPVSLLLTQDDVTLPTTSGIEDLSHPVTNDLPERVNGELRWSHPLHRHLTPDEDQFDLPL